MKYFIANWKSHKTIAEGKQWLTTFQDLLKNDTQILTNLRENKISIIVCPPFYLLSSLKEMLAEYPNFSLGSQNISPFPEGSYTGEIAARLIKDVVKFTIIGHSERRKYFHENDAMIGLKTEVAFNEGITPILCIRSEHDQIPADVKLIAYEPVEAIGTGKNATVEEVLEMKKKLTLEEGTTFIYGGSVDGENSRHYVETDGIDGLLIGTASLEPSKFFSIISTYK